MTLKISNSLSGYKTYLAAAGGIIYALYGWEYQGLPTKDATSIIETALVGAGLRKGISTEVANAVLSISTAAQPKSYSVSGLSGQSVDQSGQPKPGRPA